MINNTKYQGVMLRIFDLHNMNLCICVIHLSFIIVYRILVHLVLLISEKYTAVRNNSKWYINEFSLCKYVGEMNY